MEQHEYEAAVQGVGERAQETLGSAREAVGSTVEDLSNQTQGRIGAASEAVHRNYGAAVGAANDGLEATGEWVRKQPLIALGIAAGVGWLIGRLGRMF
ncbi:MAG: hypothetical protein FWD12_01865 [Alphaproteobacteria bacterium]|nr:hypothetical protein [Alphaproteobacteria bacterium]